MKLLRKISFGILITVLPTLVVITGKFYVEKQLTFEESSILIWTVFTVAISISLIMSCYALKKYEEVIKQNEELKKLIIDFKAQSENNHYECIEYMQGTREFIMDLED